MKYRILINAASESKAQKKVWLWWIIPTYMWVDLSPGWVNTYDFALMIIESDKGCENFKRNRNKIKEVIDVK